MKSYLNTLIIAMVVSQLAIRFAPGKESARKYVSFVCGLVVMLCLLEPISAGIKNAGKLFSDIKDMFTYSEEEVATEDKYFESASVIMSYVSDTYRIEIERIKMTLITDDFDESVIEIHIFIKDCNSEVQNEIEKELSKELSVPIFVFTG
ncbi:MAG: hypothetical protein E7628_01180 [Ruminococcaceae bacterium]|nr:hypothetical protein [Oscillospiraceae bacterium]